MGRRPRNLVGLMGNMHFDRAYYHCPHCGTGLVPLDQRIGLTANQLTPAAAEVVCVLALESSFAHASEVTLRKAVGLQLSESTVERTTESAGERLQKLLAEGETFATPKPWEWQHDALGHTCAYVSLDATGIRQQGEHGAKAEGRMAYVGMIYNPRGAAWTLQRRVASTPHQVRYLAGFYDLDDLGLELRRQAAQVGWDQAEQQIALSDGGSGIEEFFRKNFPLAVCILDFWHAKEYLVELGKTLFGEQSDEGKQWLHDRCHQLKHEGGAKTLAYLESLDVSGRSESVREACRATTTYFRNHHHKMEYPAYLTRGWQIGSGPVESACKTVVGNRLCGGGMRWGSPGSNAVCHLRALLLSERSQWAAFWRDHPN